jgi:hypothetical protein
MPQSKEGRTERYEPCGPRYLPLDFAEHAPTDCGRDGLYEWISTGLRETIERQNPAHEPFARMVTQLLWAYTTQRYQLLSKREPPEPSAGLPEEFLRRCAAPEQAEQRLIGMQLMLDRAGLGRDREILDHLFEKASAFGAALEGAIVRR